MRPTQFITTLAGAAALALASHAAVAATKVETASFSAAALDGTTQTLTLAKFDPTLGTLTSATLSFSASLASSSVVSNTSAALNLTNVSVSLFGSLSAVLDAGGPSTLPSGVSLIGTDTFMGTRIFTIVGPGATTNTGAFTQSTDPAANTFAFTSGLEALTGQGQFGYTFSSQTSASVPSRFTTIALTPSSLSSATVSITYEYTAQPPKDPGTTPPVPEPGSLALMLSGLGAGCVFLRRKERRS